MLTTQSKLNSRCPTHPCNPRMLLHAQSRELRHPTSGEAMRFVSATPF